MGEQESCREASLVLDRFLQKHPESFISFGDQNYTVWEYCGCSSVYLKFQIFCLFKVPDQGREGGQGLQISRSK